MALPGYEIVYEELHIDTASAVAKTAAAPSGKKVMGGGFRFTYDNGDPLGVEVRENGPYGGSFGDGTRWYAHVVATAAGTLRVFAVCADA